MISSRTTSDLLFLKAGSAQQLSSWSIRRECTDPVALRRGALRRTPAIIRALLHHVKTGSQGEAKGNAASKRARDQRRPVVRRTVSSSPSCARVQTRELYSGVPEGWSII